MRLQLSNSCNALSALHRTHGESRLCPIYGAGCIRKPKAIFLFMNPTAKNISAHRTWKGIRAPWIGTKNIWKIIYAVGGITKDLFEETQSRITSEWTPEFAIDIYETCAKNGLYITNLAKCTQIDARPLHTKIFEEYLPHTLEEIMSIQPEKIFSFGNQVSEILLQKPIKVSEYKKSQNETLIIGSKSFPVFPTWYPVGQGMRNMKKAIIRIKSNL